MYLNNVKGSKKVAKGSKYAKYLQDSILHKVKNQNKKKHARLMDGRNVETIGIIINNGNKNKIVNL